MSKRVKVIKIDEDHRIYVFSKKVVYRERRDGRLVTRFSGISVEDLLNSPLINDNVKKKIREKLKESF